MAISQVNSTLREILAQLEVLNRSMGEIAYEIKAIRSQNI
jgi:hypothetical protein